jgi:hypothetical protein
MSVLRARANNYDGTGIRNHSPDPRCRPSVRRSAAEGRSAVLSLWQVFSSGPEAEPGPTCNATWHGTLTQR